MSYLDTHRHHFNITEMTDIGIIRIHRKYFPAGCVGRGLFPFISLGN